MHSLWKQYFSVLCDFFTSFLKSEAYSSVIYSWCLWLRYFKQKHYVREYVETAVFLDAGPFKLYASYSPSASILLNQV